jgi:uncharacterized protein
MTDLATALALVLVIEGMLYALFPESMKRMVVQVLALPAPLLQKLGLAAACIGVGCVWLLRRL